MSAMKLPEPFTDLEPLADIWALPSEIERNQQRRSSTMDQIQTFYDTMLPRMEAVLAYLSEFPPDAAETMPADDRRLLYLTLAMVEVTTAVELYQQPSVPEGFEPERFVPDHERLKG